MTIYRVRDWAYLETPKGELWATPGQYIQARNPEAVHAFLVKSGQTHKVIAQESAPDGAVFAGVPAELCAVSVIGENRSMQRAAAPEVVKRGPGRPRKTPKPETIPAYGEEHED